MRRTPPTLSSLVRSVLLSEARNDPDSFLSYVLGSDPKKSGNIASEISMRQSRVAQMIADPSLQFASFSKLAQLIYEKQLFKPAPSASSEEWIESVRSAWQESLDATGLAELIKDFTRRLSPPGSGPTPPGSGPTPSGSGPSGGEGVRTRRSVSPDELEEILRLHGEHLKNPSAGKRADLRFADLRGADLSGANLRGALLSGADLTGADLTGANLRAVILQHVDLTGADLTGANLAVANLARALLTDADLTGADLTGAYLVSADLSGADLTGATYDKYTRFPNGFDPKAAGMEKQD